MSVQPYADDQAWIEARLGLLALRLSIEVTRLRALRADGRRENFAGVLMSDEDIAALCTELLGEGLPELKQARQYLATAESSFNARTDAMEQMPALLRLANLYELGAHENALLVFAMAPALDLRFARVFGFLHEDMSLQYLTPGLAQRLTADITGGGVATLRDCLDPRAPLLRHGLLSLTGDGPWIGRRVKIPEGVLSLLLPNAVIPDSVIVLPLSGETDCPTRPRLIVTEPGADGIIGGRFCGPLWVVKYSDADLQQALICGVAAALAGVTIVYDGWDGAEDTTRRNLLRSLGRHAAILTRRPALWHGQGTTLLLTRVQSLSSIDRRVFWSSLVDPKIAKLLAAETVIDAASLWRLAKETHDAPSPHESLSDMIRQRGSEPMQGLADRVECPFDFVDLVLPDSTKAQLKSFAARRQSAETVLEEWGLRRSLNAGRGAIALFSGPSGTGKTMSAGIVAREAQLDLWRINLATVVSKYIGETEANLEKVFAAAGDAEVMLFFDESESLFAKRAEVRDARDRYANMEMSYLLQRLESFPGMAVLATNMSTTLDPALLRRFDLVLSFPLPDTRARRELWGKLETASVPLATDIDLDQLAESFKISGGHIRQAILSAAHQAAQEDGVLTRLHLLQAVAREYVKLGMTLRREDFGDLFARVRGYGG